MRLALLALALACGGVARAEDFSRAEVEAAVGRPFHGINLSAIGPYRPDMTASLYVVGDDPADPSRVREGRQAYHLCIFYDGQNRLVVARRSPAGSRDLPHNVTDALKAILRGRRS